jgi:tetratricopeptide (TPR) repeat protein
MLISDLRFPCVCDILLDQARVLVMHISGSTGKSKPAWHVARTMSIGLIRFLRTIVVLTILGSSQLSLSAITHAQSSGLAERVEKLRKTKATDEQKLAKQLPQVEAYQKMLKSVALVRIYSDDGYTSGTAWLIDAENRIFVTNQHVIEGSADCTLYFPEYRDGKLLTDPTQAIRDERAHVGTVIDSAVEYDLALIQLKEAIPEGCVPLEIAERPAAPGEKIHSLAGSTVGSQSLWVYSTGHVRQTVRGSMANGYEATLLESDMATNQGNSGGPVCNDQGEVIAVVEGHVENVRLVSIYVSQESLLEYLADGLRCVNPKTVEDLKFASERNLREERTDYALELVTGALKLEPENASLYCLRGWCWYELDDRESSLGDFDEALQLDRRCPDAHYGKAAWARDLGDFEEALESISTAIRNNPSSSDYFICRGQIYGMQEMWDKALQDFTSALRKDPDSSEARLHLGYANIELKNYEQGIAELEQVVSIYSDDPTIFMYYGIAFEGLGRTAEAIDFYMHSRSLDPEDSEILFRLAGVLIQTEQYQAALDPLYAALETGEEEATASFLVGICLYTLKDPSFKQYLARAAELDPENEDFAEAYRRASDSRRGEQFLVYIKEAGPWLPFDKQ